MDIDGVYYCSKCMKQMEENGICPHCGYDASLKETYGNYLEEGTFLYDRYLFGAVIGAGGFGVTYAAWDTMLKIPVAIKEYYPGKYACRNTEVSDDIVPYEEHTALYAIGLDRFRREAQVLAQFKNLPGVVGVDGCFEENNTCYIVMEYVCGIPLDEYVNQHYPDPRELLRMMRLPIDALEIIHRQGIHHRDITPHNMLVQEDGSIKLIDFGSAREINHETNLIVVSDGYAPVEQYDTQQAQGPWGDIYSLCATMYHMLTGEMPPVSLSRMKHDTLKKPSELGIRLKKHEQRALMAGLAADPQKRVRSMDEFRSMLYNMPMPEEVRRRKAFMKKVYAAALVLMLMMSALLANYTVGLPLGEGLLYALHPDGWHIVGQTSEKEIRQLPNAKMGIPVSRIREYAFEGDALLRQVSIPGSVKLIGDMAFRNCTALEMASAADGVSEIGEYAFAECPQLHTLELPGTLEVLPKNAYEGAHPLLTVWGELNWKDFGVDYLRDYPNFASREDYEIEANPTGVTIAAFHGEGKKAIFGEGVFSDSKDEIHSNKHLTLPSVIDGQWVTQLLNDGERILQLPEDLESVILPEYVDTLKAGIFSGREALRYIRFGSSMKELGSGALKNTGLMQAAFCEGLDRIDDEVFYGTKLKEIHLPDTLEYIGSSAFFAVSGVEEIVIPASVAYIGESAFSACVSLRKATFSEGLVQIPDGIFENCRRLEDVRLSDSIVEIGAMAFKGCDSLRYMYIPESVKRMDYYAFAESGLQYISLPDSLDAPDSEVNTYLFSGCANDLVIEGSSNSLAEKYAAVKGYRFENRDLWLRQILISGKTALDGIAENRETVYLPSFNSASNLLVKNVDEMELADSRTVYLPEFCETIGVHCFRGHSALEQVIVPDTLRTIKIGAFKDCSSLKTFSFPPLMEQIDAFAFSGCSSLTDLILPEGISTLGNNAFDGCSKITEIKIPSSVVVLDDAVFARTGIRDIVVPGTVSRCRAAFFGCKELRTADVKEGVRDLWETFYGCEKLESVVLPASLEHITECTFAGCTGLKEVTFYADNFIINEGNLVDDILVLNGDVSEKSYIGRKAGVVPEHMFADCPDVTIFANAGSTMENYAKQHGLRFISLEEKKRMETEALYDEIYNELCDEEEALGLDLEREKIEEQMEAIDDELKELQEKIREDINNSGIELA